MPIYEYHCPHCNETFDALQKVSDRPLEECRTCGQKGLKKIASSFKININEPHRMAKDRMK